MISAMVSDDKFLRDVHKHPERFYIIHYSSQSLFDAETDAHSPRITSTVVRHFMSGQTVSFSDAHYRGIPSHTTQ